MATSQLLISRPHSHGSAIDWSHRKRATTKRALRSTLQRFRDRS